MDRQETGMDFFDKISSRMQPHPETGYLIVAGLLALWLFGVIRRWKWTYGASSWKQNALREMLGAGVYRFCIGAILAVAIAITLYLYSVAGK